MSTSTAPIIPPADGEYAQLFCFSIDMVGSELFLANTSPGRYREGISEYHGLVDATVSAAGGRLSAWHGDGNVAFFSSKGDEDPLIVAGEAAARSVLDDLFTQLPDKRFRVGAGTAPVRYWDDVQTLHSRPAIVLATRLQSFARQVANGSVLLIPGDVHSALGSAEQALYRVISSHPFGDLNIFAYVPTGAGEYIAPPLAAHEPQRVSPANESASMLPVARSWPGGNQPYVEVLAYPTDASGDRLFNLTEHNDWLMNHVLELPIGSPIFKEESIRDNTLEVYLAEHREAERLQYVKFFGTGKLVFGDCGWSRLPGWQGVFYPQVLNSMLPKIVAFGCEYFSACLRQRGEAFFRVEIGNIGGCVRKVQRIGTIPPRKFVFTRDIAAGESIDLQQPDQDALIKKLYDKVMIESELDPRKWGYGTERPSRG